jgi:acyl-coenzyme A synthetase/AMP-(fatty) acid ligase
MRNFFNDLENFSDQIAFTTIEEQITYQEIIDESNVLSHKMKARDLAFILCDNTIESVTAYITCLRLKIVPLLIGSSIDEELLSNLIKSYLPNYIWTSRSIEYLDDWKVLHQNRTFNLLENSLTHNHIFHPDLAALLMTSGSTGSPVLVRISYENLIQNTISISESLSITGKDKPITTLPMNYTYGLSIINSHLLNGCEIILTDKSILSKEFWQLINEKKPSTFGGVPYTYQMLRKLGFEKMDLPFITKITQAGGKLDAQSSLYFAEICNRKGIEFFVMYGQTEATARMSYLPSKDAIRKFGSIGIAIPNGSFYLLNDYKEEILEADTVGELYYKGPNVSLGYAYTKEDFIKGDENNSILATGDLAKRDEDGYYYIVGRKKRYIKIFGNRISLDEVENLTLKHGLFCVCSGVDDKLIVYTENEQEVDELKSLISTKINIHHSAIQVKYIKEIPRNDSGKILYSELQSK